MLLQDEEKELLKRSPPWLLVPLPPNAVRDNELIEQIKRRVEVGAEVCSSLDRILPTHAYPLAANLANSLIWELLPKWVRLAPTILIKHATLHMPRPAQHRVLRRLAKSPNTEARRIALTKIRQLGIRETMLPPKGHLDGHSWRSGLGKESFDGGAFRRGEGAEIEQLNLPEIETIAQLREVLQIKSSNQLGWFLQSSEGEGKPYHSYSIPKRNGTSREICAPNWQLRRVQQRILRKILAPVEVHPCAHGFVPDRSIVSNAQPHVGSKLVLKFDLQDFFPTITYARVIGLFTSLGYFGSTVRFSRDDDSHNVASTLARLCVFAFDPHEWITAYCPQGAPTSPTISNLICRGLDARCEGLAKACSGKYTRYADDLTFSFPTTDLNIGRFRWWVDQICHQEGFYVNHRKFRLMRASRRQTVTGIVVNDCLRIPREQRRRLRAILHDAEKNGLQAAARGRPRFASWLRGYAAYINMVHPEEGAEMVTRVRKLIESDTERDGGDA